MTTLVKSIVNERPRLHTHISKMLRLCVSLTLAVVGVFVISSSAITYGQASTDVAQIEIYAENFSSYDYVSSTVGVEWNIFSHTLTAALQDAIGQQNAKVVYLPDETFVVVWKDYRAGYWNLFGQRYNPDGYALWPADVKVNQGGTMVEQYNPGIAVDPAGNVLVVWDDDRNGNSDIFAQKITTNGLTIWGTDLRINSDLGGTDQDEPSIALDNTGNSIITWTDGRNSHGDIYAQKIDSAGNSLWPSDVRINADTGSSGKWRSGIAVSGGSASIAWTDLRDGNSDIYAQRINAAGTRLWGADVEVNSDGGSTDQSNPDIVVDTVGNSVIVWRDYRNNNCDVYAQRLNTLGSKQWPNDVRANSDSSTTDPYGSTAVLGSGDNTIVAWYAYTLSSHTHNIYRQSISPAGALIYSPTDLELDSGIASQRSPDLAVSLVGDLMVIWHEGVYQADVAAQKFDGAMNPKWPSTRILTHGSGTAVQTTPKFAFLEDGSAMATWYDDRDQGIHAQRIFSNGGFGFSNTVKINQDPAYVSYGLGFAAYPNGDTIAAWWGLSNGKRAVFAQRLDPNGNRLWPQDVRINQIDLNGGMEGMLPDISVDTTGSGDAVVLWSGTPFAGGSSSLYSQRIDPSGDLRWLTDVPVNTTTGGDLWPDIATGKGENAIVTWIYSGNVFAQKIDALGNHVWNQDVQVNANSGITHSWLSSIGVDSNGYAVIVWETNSTDYSDYAIYAQRLSPSGARQWVSDIRVSTDTERKEHPTVAVDSVGNAAVFWTDFRYGYDGSKYGCGDIYGQKLNTSGNRLWVGDIRVNDSSLVRQAQWYPTASFSGTNVIVAWSDWRNGNEDTYLQRLNSNGTRQWSSDLQLVNPDYFYYPSGFAESKSVDAVTAPILQATLSADDVLNGGGVQFYLTNSGGTNWSAVTPGVAMVFTTTGSDLRWRAELTADPLWPRTPVINSIRIEYSTQTPYADSYEPDDACSQAKPIAVNGAAQAHTFHQYADADWVWFDVISGTTYILQTANPQLNADTTLELRPSCPQPPLGTDDNVFGRDARITWRAIFTGAVYAKAANHSVSVYGADTGYDLSVRTYTQPPVVVIVGGHDNGYSLQSNIDYLSDLAYRTFLNSGVPKANIRYFSPNPNRDVDGNGLNDDIFATATITNVRDAVQDWSRSRGVSLGVPFYLYLVDHGYYDQFLAAGSTGRVFAEQLNLWLSNLEATSGADNINIILEACKSGSFIDVTTLGPNKISGWNRVVIASTSSTLDAYPSLQGAYFSDVFWTAVGQNQDLKTAFETAKQAVQATGLRQQPWLDDNGDAVADALDGPLARGRGLGLSFGDRAPAIDWVQVGDIASGTGTVQAQIRDDFGVDRAWVVVYPPGFIAPPPSPDPTTPVLNVPTRTLTLAGADLFTTSFNGFTQTGWYRVVAYAQDMEQHQALPQSMRVCVSCSVVYLPLVMKGY